MARSPVGDASFLTCAVTGTNYRKSGIGGQVPENDVDRSHDGEEGT